MLKKIIPVLGFLFLTIIFFWQFFLKGLMPIPSDTIVGLYHPYRDFYQEYPNGIPFKNFLITDPVRQIYPWKHVSTQSVKDLDIPSWNPYSFSGMPLIGNFQSGVFYPLNLIFNLLPFNLAWTIFIMLQPFLAGVFMFYFLKNLKLDVYASFIGGVVFAFSGFFAMWLEWGNVLHTALWLPLILLSIDKISSLATYKNSRGNLLLWSILLIGGSSFSFFAGHLQTFFYIFIVSFIYSFFRLLQNKNIKFISTLIICLFAIFLISLPQLISTFKLISLSGRELDQMIWQKDGWFIPLQHIIQFMVPDFFGNPSTLNYWGTWNYGELTGYVGITAFILALIAILVRRDKITFFFLGILICALIFSIQNPISKLPYLINIPLLSTAQPTRLICIISFSFAALAALGFNRYLLGKKNIRIFIPMVWIGLFYLIIHFIISSINPLSISQENLLVARRNLIFPIIIFATVTITFVSIKVLNKRLQTLLILALIIISTLDLFRFSWKFNTFSKEEYLYPQTKSINFLQSRIGNHRFATNDPRILAPNFSLMYRIQTVEGYDPLYLERYAQLIAAINRNKPDISPPFGFNRIIRIENYENRLVDMLGVKYILSLDEVRSPKYTKVFEEGRTKVYENKNVFNRAYFVENLELAKNKEDAITKIFDENIDLNKTAIVEENIIQKDFSSGSARILEYRNDRIIIETQNEGEGFLILTDSFYPTWRAMIENQEAKIYRANYNFRGIIVPPGKNKIVFDNKIL